MRLGEGAFDGWGMLACEREKRNTYRVLMGRPKGKRLLERSSHIWEMILK
jgi:hypothetical protein